MTKNILLWGGLSQSMLLKNMIYQGGAYENFEENPVSYDKLLDLNKTNSDFNIRCIYDPFIKVPSFKGEFYFSNKKSDLKKFVNDCQYFIVGIGGDHGRSRSYISSKLETFGLKPLSVLDKNICIASNVLLGKGIQILTNVTINYCSKIGDYSIINTSSTIDHECIIGQGFHAMGSSAIAGLNKIEDYVTVGTNATICPSLILKEDSYIGAGSVVVENVEKNKVVVGNPAKFIKDHDYQIPSDNF